MTIMKGFLLACLLVVPVSSLSAQQTAIFYSAPSTASLQNQGSDTAPLGAELVANGAFNSDASSWTAAGWTWGAGKIKHDSGNVTALSQNITVADGVTYQVNFVTADRTVGDVTVAINGVVVPWKPYTIAYNENGSENVRTFIAVGSGAQALTFTPTNTYDGSLDDVSVKPITALASTVSEFKDSTGGIVGSVRGYAAQSSIGIGGSGPNFAHACSVANCYAPLSWNTIGYYNTALGYGALSFNTVGAAQTAIGYQALNHQTSGQFNTAVGSNSMYSATIGWHNTAIGAQSMYYNTTGFYNTCLGYATCYLNQTGKYNVSVGLRALYTNINSYNTAVGTYALNEAADTYYNTGVGNSALQGVTSGNNNTSIGASAGYEHTPGTKTYAVTTGSKNTFVGAYANFGSATQRTNATAIGSRATVDSDNTVVLGDADVTSILASSDGGATITAAAIKIGANMGISGTIVVKGSDGNNCNLVFEGGVLTSETCP